jgi:hypothetical protein
MKWIALYDLKFHEICSFYLSRKVISNKDYLFIPEQKRYTQSLQFSVDNEMLIIMELKTVNSFWIISIIMICK